MKTLTIRDLEQQDGHTLLFPAFNLDADKQEVIALLTNAHVRQVLLKMFIGEIQISTGEININGCTITSSKKQFHMQVGICSLDDGLYERLRVKDHLSFYQRLYGASLSVEDSLLLLQLESKKYTHVHKLSLSEKRRLQFGRLLFQNPAVYIFEEPDQNADLETKRVFMKLVRSLQKNSKTVLFFTSNMESALSVTNQVYRLDDKGLQNLDILSEEEDSEQEEVIAVSPVRFEKIPTKVNDKIVLFDPPEIDYIESDQGQTFIYIKGEAFPGVFTLTELEKRLHPYGFFRCHRSYIVNLQKVREVITFTRNSYSLVLADTEKSTIPLSKNKMLELKEILGLK